MIKTNEYLQPLMKFNIATNMKNFTFNSLDNNKIFIFLQSSLFFLNFNAKQRIDSRFSNNIFLKLYNLGFVFNASHIKKNIYEDNQLIKITIQNYLFLKIKNSNFINKKLLNPVFSPKQNGYTFLSQSYSISNVVCSKIKTYIKFYVNPHKIFLNQICLDFHRLFFYNFNKKFADAVYGIKCINLFHKHYLFIDPECLFREPNLVNDKQTKSTFYKTHTSYKEIQYGFVNAKENLIYSSQLV